MEEADNDRFLYENLGEFYRNLMQVIFHRWGHSGFKELYSEEVFQQFGVQGTKSADGRKRKSSSDRSESSHDRDRKRRKMEKKKKRHKEKRKHKKRQK